MKIHILVIAAFVFLQADILQVAIAQGSSSRQLPASRRNSAHSAGTASSVVAAVPAGPVDSMLPHYRGMNAAKIFGLLNDDSSQMHRSEYETEAQYKLRSDALMSQPIVGGRGIRDQYTFVLGGAWDGQASASQDHGGGALSYLSGAVETEYDAESEIMKVKVPIIAGTEDMSEYASFGWSYSSHITGHHVGANAFGVRKVVTEGKSLRFTIEIANHDFFWLRRHCDYQGTVGLSCSFAISRDDARAIDGKIRVAVGGNLRTPYVREEENHTPATIDSPYEDYDVTRGLYIVPNQVVVFNNLTGAVLAQYSVEAFEKDYGLQLRISEDPAPYWSNPLCDESVRDYPITFNYQADGHEKIHVFKPKLPVEISATSSITLSMPFCMIPRLAVSRNGRPYRLTCQEQEQYAMNQSECEAIK